MNDIKKEHDILAQLLHDKEFARLIAEKQFSAYYIGKGETPPAFPSTDKEIAVNMAGFYALECCVDYLSGTSSRLPSAILKTIAEGSIPDSEKELFCRFANATWKAGQPFQGLERIERPVFVPFSDLEEHDIAKDWKQIQTAAEIVLEYL